MKDDQFVKLLDGLEVPEPTRSAHQELLRKALVDASHSDGKAAPKHEKGFFTMRRKIFASAAFGLASLVAIAVSVIILTPGEQASAAQDLAKHSSAYVSTLSPDDKAGLTQRFHTDPQELLDEAQQAPDLTLLTYDQLKDDHADIFAMIPTPGGGPEGGLTVRTGGPAGSGAGMPGPVSGAISGGGTGNDAGPATLPPAPDLASMKFLLFTNSQGQKTLLGVGGDDGPTLCVTIDGSGVVSGSVTMQADGSTTGTPPQAPAGDTGEKCSRAPDGQAQCTAVIGPSQ